jgi:subtilisin family serine protease
VNRTSFGLQALPAWAALSALLAMSAGAHAAGPVPGKAKGKTTHNAYIVQFAEMPVSAYDGGIRGLQATKPKKGQKLDPNAPAVVNYMAHLASQHDKAMASVGASRKLYSYGYVFNGMAVDLTPAQAQKLAQLRGVVSVTKDEFRHVDTATTPAFLGLSGTNGLWNSATGENVIIGIIDSGVWPEHLSFSDRTGSNGNASKDGKLAYQQIPGWNGKCTPGEAFAASNCNQKLIGARYYNAGFGGNAGIDSDLPFEFNSPRDHNGHGTHTASTAGGNANVTVSGGEAAYGRISGIAPRARIAAYTACWSVPGTAGSCSGVDLVAAIDQAVADGVDVINYSISGSTTNFRDPVEIAFLFAADAGVFVAASAGNSGPNVSTVAHPSPWITTVAAGTHDRAVQGGSVTLGNGTTYTGVADVSSVGPRPLVDGALSGLAGADANLTLCFGTADDGVARLDPAKVAGKIVVCNRGGNVLVNKALAVQAAGGVGMVLVNTPTSANTTPFVSYAIPAVHLTNSVYDAVKGYAAVAGASATINGANIVTNAQAPFTASFSSRGPLLASGDLLKPDIIAPGQDILAGVAPPNNGGRLFGLYSGTSMSSPHVAGIAALLKGLHPSWSPMAIKSAIMTTAGDVLDGPNTNPLVIFRQGAGHVQPAGAANPGLVFDSGYVDWLGFLCGTQLPTDFCTSAGIPVLEPSNFNSPSIAIANLAGSRTVKRRLTNVSGNPATFTASAVMPGFTVTVSPAQLTLAAGQTGEVTITVARTSAPLNAYGGGQLTWSDGTQTVRIPIVARPVALGAPVEVTGTAAGLSYNIGFGYDGAFSATARGLVPAGTIAGSVVDDPANDINTALGTGVGITIHQVNVPAGTTYARFALFDNATDGNDDLDLYVFNPSGALAGSSGSGTSAEEVNVANPVAGTWFVAVHGWQTDGPNANYTLFSWTLGSTAAGNMTVNAPAIATTGGTGTIALSFSGLAPATRFLGSIVYGGSTGMPPPTIVRVDTP